MSVTDQRRVRKLYLSAPDATLGRRGVHLLEDALHTASLPAAGPGKVLVVRRLKVGRIDPTQSAATLALAIERQMRQLAASAVYALAPGATEQPAVYFQDELEPYTALALKLARGEQPTAWFWPLVIRGWRAQMDARQGLRWLLAEAGRSSTGVAGLLRLVDHLHQHATLDPLLAALPAGDGAPLLALCGWQAQQPASGARPVSVPALSAAWQSTLLRWQARWGADDARLRWLAAVALAASKPMRLVDQRSLMQSASQLVQQMATPGYRSAEQRVGNVHSLAHRDDAEKQTAEIAIAPTRVASEQVASTPATGTSHASNDGFASPAHGAPEAMRSAHRTPPQRMAAPLVNRPQPTAKHLVEATKTASTTANRVRTASATVDRVQGRLEASQTSNVAGAAETTLDPFTGWQASEYAGLFFLTSVLTRLGMAEWLRAEPRWIEGAFPYQLLRYLCQQLAAPSVEPILTLLDQLCAASDQTRWAGETVRFVSPTGWHALNVQGDAPADQSPATWLSMEAVCARWLAALEQWCNRYSELSLAEIVCRPGQVIASATHIDLFFALHQADLRIRKAGLDVDPGWVPWLGRVVQFHYTATG